MKPDYKGQCEELLAIINGNDEEHGDDFVKQYLIDQLLADGLITGEWNDWTTEGETYDSFVDLMENNVYFYEVYLPILTEYVEGMGWFDDEEED